MYLDGETGMNITEPCQQWNFGNDQTMTSEVRDSEIDKNQLFISFYSLTSFVTKPI